MRWQIAARADTGCQLVVAARASDHDIEAFGRKFRSDILCGTQDNLLVTALDQNIGQSLRQSLASRNRQQVLLISGARAFDQGFGIEALGLRENGRGDLDRVVAGEDAQDLWWRTGDRSETDCE